MPCYHPYLGRPSYRDGVNVEGKYRYNIVGWFDPSVAEPKDIRIPCGKCIGCRLDYSRQWADRMILELQHHDGKAIFATLTYDNEHVPVAEYEDFECPGLYFPLGIGDRMLFDHVIVPKKLTLDRQDLSKFMKRLRSRKKFEDREIRFYGAGEYGSHTRRPHLHVIIFGISLDDFDDLRQRGVNELGQSYFTSKEFQGIWKNGFILITEVSWKTCAYVSRYVMKKAYADDLSYDQLPEFSQMSRRPGIGAYYFLEHPDCIEQSNIYLSSKEGSVKVGIPKYFMSKVKVQDPDLYDRIQLERKEHAMDQILLKLQKTDLSYVEQLEIEENLLLDKVDILNKIRL